MKERVEWGCHGKSGYLLALAAHTIALLIQYVLTTMGAYYVIRLLVSSEWLHPNKEVHHMALGISPIVGLLYLLYQVSPIFPRLVWPAKGRREGENADGE